MNAKIGSWSGQDSDTHTAGFVHFYEDGEEADELEENCYIFSVPTQDNDEDLKELLTANHNDNPLTFFKKIRDVTDEDEIGNINLL